MNRVLRLTPALQHYEWGGYDFIPRLVGTTSPGRKPHAELWLGAHASAPSLVEGVRLDEFIAHDPQAVLGVETAARFGGRLPYLLKVLDARGMLSIQAHPTRAQAVAGLARGNRDYQDGNHKPEVHVAITEFWMLHGFRPLDDAARVIRETPEFAPLSAHAGSVRGLYEHVMTMPQAQVDALLRPLVERLRRQPPTGRDQPAFWAHRAALHFARTDGICDRGIFSIYLLNLVHLDPGQGTYQPAGVLHAYLEGVTVELMANSDNVLRGGLTTKHVDVPELLRTLTYEAGVPAILRGEDADGHERVYRTAAEEFELSRIDLPLGAHIERAARGPEILLVASGSASLDGELLARGAAVLVPAGMRYRIVAEELVVLFRAVVPAL